MSDFKKIDENLRNNPFGSKLDLGVYGKENNSNSFFIDITAIVLSIVWVIFSILFLTFREKTNLNSSSETSFIINCLAVFVPVAMIATISMSLKISRKLKEQTIKLQTEIDALRRTYVTQQQVSGLSVKSNAERQNDEATKLSQKTETEVAQFSTRRDLNDEQIKNPALKKTKPSFLKEEPLLPLEEDNNALNRPNTLISVGEFIRAANFPDDENDKEGLSSLRKALLDRDLAKLLHAAQDSLRIMSEDGVYIDSIQFKTGKVELWRNFGNGKRGKKLSGILNFDDDTNLQKVNSRFKEDTVFKDVTHHFLRQFDLIFTEFSKNASDDEILQFSKTRTALVFLILANIAGTFD